jgi:hypothetical protein
MSSANLLWGAPRILGELTKIGIDLSPSTVVIAWMTRATMRADRAAV